MGEIFRDLALARALKQKNIPGNYDLCSKLRLRSDLSILILVRLQNNLSRELPGALWGYSLQCGVRFLLTLSLNAAFSFSLTSGCLG